MNKEEAIQVLKKLKDGSSLWTYSENFEEIDEAIETVLAVLEKYEKQLDLDYVEKNYIPKQVIEEKYRFYENKVKKIRESNRKYSNATKYDYLTVGQRDALQELLEGK